MIHKKTRYYTTNNTRTLLTGRVTEHPFVPVAENNELRTQPTRQKNVPVTCQTFRVCQTRPDEFLTSFPGMRTNKSGVNECAGMSSQD